jgi:hypothetical protein
MPVHWSTSIGLDANTQAAGINVMEMLGGWMPACCMLNAATPADHRNLVLVPLLLEHLKAPEKLPEFALGEPFP